MRVGPRILKLSIASRYWHFRSALIHYGTTLLDYANDLIHRQVKRWYGLVSELIKLGRWCIHHAQHNAGKFFSIDNMNELKGENGRNIAMLFGLKDEAAWKNYFRA